MGKIFKMITIFKIINLFKHSSVPQLYDRAILLSRDHPNYSGEKAKQGVFGKSKNKSL